MNRSHITVTHCPKCGGRVGYEHCPDCRKKIERRIRRAAEYRSR